MITLSKRSLAISLALLLSTDLTAPSYAQNNKNRNNNRNNNNVRNNNSSNNKFDFGGMLSNAGSGSSRARRRCTLYKYDALVGPNSKGSTPDTAEEDRWHCFLEDEDDPTAYSLSGAGLPSNFIKKNMKNWKSGKVMLDMSSVAKYKASNSNGNQQRAKLDVGQGSKISIMKKKSRNGRNGRNLADATGRKTVLIVRVSDSDGMQPTRSASELYNDILGDNFNMATIYDDCSGGQLTFKAASNGNSIIQNGVVDLQLSGESFAGRSSFNVQGLVDDAIKANPNIVGGSLSQWDHVFYVLPDEVNFGCCDVRAYAYINGQRSVYKDEASSVPFVVAHEIGHNLGLQHSGKSISGSFNPYGDKTCIMSQGLSEFFTTERDLPKMCFNARKSFELGWYEDRTITLVQGSAWKGKLIGVNDYFNDQTNKNEHYVVAKIPGSRGTDLYVAYNRKEGITADTPDEENEDDKVVIIGQDTTNPSSPSQNLKALDVGKSYEFDDNIIQVCQRKTGSPDYAEISVCPKSMSDCSCSNTPTTPSGCPSGQKRFQLRLLTDNWGGETSYKVEDDSGVVESRSSFESSTEYNVDKCIPKNACKFTIEDSYGDGICCSYGIGSYEVSIDGNVVGSGGEFSSKETVDICIQGEDDPPSPDPPSNNCPNGQDEFVLELTTDSRPEEIKWVIKQGVDPWRGVPVLARRDWGYYTSQGTYTEVECLPSNENLMFRILDASRNGGNSYSLSLNGVELFSSSGNYGRKETTAFQGSALGAIQGSDTNTDTEPIDQDLMNFIAKLERRGRTIPCLLGAAGETCDEDDECCGQCMDNYRCSNSGSGVDVNVYYERNNGNFGGNGNGNGNGNRPQSNGRQGGRFQGGLRH